jgi:voltage-gated potassium channel
MKNVQKRLFELLETSTGDRPSRIIDTLLIALIICNVVAVTLHTVHSLAVKYDPYFRRFETFSVIVFSIEYVLRIWICVLNESYRRPVLGRIRYFFSPFAIIDLVAVAPFYLPMLIPVDLIFIRSLRLLRLLRLLKLGRYSESIKTMGAVLKAKKEAITVAATMSIILLLMASALMYFIENGEQPDAFSSIPAAMWWGVTTMTTVGYGDVYPVTPAGKVLAGIIAVLGIGLFILPAGIIAAGYAEEIQRKKDEHLVCPKCGNVIS